MPAKRSKADGGTGKACEDLLTFERIPWYRMNSGDIFIPNKNGSRRRIRLQEEGTADYLCHPTILRPENRELGIWEKAVVWIEAKRLNGKARDKQLEFADAARNRGEIHLLIDDARQLQDWLKENRAR